MRFLSICVFLFFNNFLSFSQPKFPKGYFLMPIQPGQQTSLSGCFGDIRTNHFHAGLDIRTGGVEGKNVYAAAEGYISRMKIQNGGYGNALYITHPNGYTTLYAHLKVFNDTLQKYLVRQQYAQKTWEIDFALEPHQFPVRKGEIVALSGNTGGSAGPHLHFEIRNAQEEALDPSQFGFADLSDSTPPIIQFISLKTMSDDARINGKFGIFNFPVVRGKDGLYRIAQKISAKGTLGLEVLAFDKATNSPFRQGVSQINLVVNHKPVYNFRLDKMQFDNKLDMNIHVNYKKMNTSGLKIHKCYVEEGNGLDLYTTNTSRGKFEIENESNVVELRVSDAFANTIFAEFEILKEKETLHTTIPNSKIKTEILDNFLKIEVEDFANEYSGLSILKNNTQKQIPFDEVFEKTKVKILDLKNGLPEEIQVNDIPVTMPVNTLLSKSNPIFEKANLKFNFGEMLYHDEFVNITSNESEIHFHEDIIPLKGKIDITWTKSTAPSNAEKHKAYLKGSKMKYLGGEWTNNVLNFQTREFGTIQLLNDFDPPTIVPKALTKESLKFRISDGLSGIKTISCYVNDEWVLMNFEYKNGMIWSEKLKEAKPFIGNIVLRITDYCNNTQIFETQISEK